MARFIYSLCSIVLFVVSFCGIETAWCGNSGNYPPENSESLNLCLEDDCSLLKKPSTLIGTTQEVMTANKGGREIIEVITVAKSNQIKNIQIWVEPATGIEFVYVEGGCFQMGCGNWNRRCGTTNTPLHEVCIDSFWISRFEITQGQWRAIMGNNPSFFQKGDTYPVEQVSWIDTKIFSEKLRKINKNKYRFRLPSEAEWEYSCRSGGKKIRYPWGLDDPLCRKNTSNGAKFDDNKGCDATATEPVGSYAPNDLGLFDLSGNVWEWCEDVYAGDAYSAHKTDNPASSSGDAYRVIRGGSWFNGKRRLECANRYKAEPTDRLGILGFRLVRDL